MINSSQDYINEKENSLEYVDMCTECGDLFVTESMVIFDEHLYCRGCRRKGSARLLKTKETRAKEFPGIDREITAWLALKGIKNKGVVRNELRNGGKLYFTVGKVKDVLQRLVE